MPSYPHRRARGTDAVRFPSFDEVADFGTPDDAMQKLINQEKQKKQNEQMLMLFEDDEIMTKMMEGLLPFMSDEKQKLFKEGGLQALMGDYSKSIGGSIERPEEFMNGIRGMDPEGETKYLDNEEYPMIPSKRNPNKNNPRSKLRERNYTFPKSFYHKNS